MPTYSNTYDPNNATQAAFLAALQAGENAGGNPSLGFGGANLANAPTDAYGFPIWAGATTSAGPTHAAGLFQFQPGTWDSIAAQTGLNFQNPADQAAAAWDLASANFKAKTGGDLQTALQSGNYTQVANALSPTWTSLNPTRLANAFQSGATPTVNGTSLSGAISSALGTALNPAGTIAGAIGSFLGLSQWQGDIVNLATRGFVIVLAIVIIAFGLFFLADRASGGQVIQTAATATKAALA